MLAAAARAPWQNPRVVSTLAMVFLAGAASGALSMKFGLHDMLHRTAVSSPAASRQTVLERFNSELDLTQDQSRKIANVLEEYTQYYQSLQDQLDDVRATGRTQILQILDPGQRDKFDKIMKDLAPQFEGPASK